MSIQWYPGHMTKARRELAAAIPAQDVVIEVLDARMPAASENPVVTELRGPKPCLKVLSKSDLADPATTEAWLRYFESPRPAGSTERPPERSAVRATEGQGEPPSEGATEGGREPRAEGGREPRAEGGREPRTEGTREPPFEAVAASAPSGPVLAVALRTDRPGEARAQVAELCRRLTGRSAGSARPVRALIAGVPNVGKSTLINTLMNRIVANVSDKPAVTKAQQQVILKNGMVLWDSPGIMWPKIENETAALRLALAGSIPDTAIDYVNVALFGARLFLARYPDRLLTRFKLTTLPPTAEALVAEIGRRRGCLRSGGTIDLHKASEILVHEFRSGGLGRISLETPEDLEGLAPLLIG